MRNVFFIVAAFAFLQSCGSDDTGASGSGMLLQSVTTVSSGETRVVTHVYNGHKLSTISYSDGTVWAYTYTGSKITHVEVTNSGNLIRTIDFEYAGGKLSTATYFESETNVTAVDAFSYPDAHTVVMHSQIGSGGNGSVNTFDIDDEGEIVHVENTDASVKVDYQYDDQHNPMLNVTGWADIRFIGGFYHNITYDQTTWNGVAATPSLTTYEYNAQGFPTSSTSTKMGQVWSSSQFVYVGE